MALFDAPDEIYPTRWKDYSLDYQLFFIFHGCMLALFATFGKLSVKHELLLAVLLATILFSISLIHRDNMNWRWPGVQIKGIVSVAGVIVLAAIFEFTASPLFPPSDPRFLPWYMAVSGIAVFQMFRMSNVVQLSKSDFLSKCEFVGTADFQAKPRAEKASVGSTDPMWKRVTRGIYKTCSLLASVAFLAFFYLFSVAYRDGSPDPTSTKTEPLNDHGRFMYVTHPQKALIDSLQGFVLIAIPCIIAIGLILHFFAGVKMFPNVPTLEEWREQRRKEL